MFCDCGSSWASSELFHHKIRNTRVFTIYYGETRFGNIRCSFVLKVSLQFFGFFCSFFFFFFFFLFFFFFFFFFFLYFFFFFFFFCIFFFFFFFFLYFFFFCLFSLLAYKVTEPRSGSIKPFARNAMRSTN